MFRRKRNAFTLVELMVAIAISVIVMFFIGTFITDSLTEIGDSSNNSRILVNFEDFQLKLDSYRNVFLTGGNLIDNTGTGSDVLILQSLEGDSGVIFGVVNKKNMRLERTQEEYETYYDKVLGFKELSESEISEVSSNPTKVYDYSFFNDTLFHSLQVVDFQSVFYNSGSIIDMSLEVTSGYRELLDGTAMFGLETNSITKYNVNF